uniref:RecA family profile 1 domain-containing protein n=1 Tax=Leptocylindrus danicus TaxID=163516 RepID=A0A7S2LK22_9STRA|mmetsp:Transcript_618/g.844  ORF Transcript_618/g.844 Transcript_618/m.844 type:complete len:497 (+) Transcript_618:33-1523(+)
MSQQHRAVARLPLKIFTNLTLTSNYPIEPKCLKEQIVAKLSKRGITTVGALLDLSALILLRMLDPLLTYPECKRFYFRVCKLCCAVNETALDLIRKTRLIVDDGGMLMLPRSWRELNSMRHIPSGMKALDLCLKGGFRVGTITEVFGRAGVGKTQLAMQLCVIAARYRQGSIFIDTERKLSLRRLQEIARERHAEQQNGQDISQSQNLQKDTYNFTYDENDDNGGDNTCMSMCTDEQSEKCSATTGDDTTNLTEGGCSEVPYMNHNDVLNNVTVHSPKSTEDLLASIASLEGEILTRNEKSNAADRVDNSDESNVSLPVRLVVIDSIAAPARRDFGSESGPQRLVALFQIAQMLKRLADQLQVAIVVINQVGSLVDDPRGESNSSSVDGNATRNILGKDYVSVTAALGSSWQHCVSSRLLLEHERDPHRQDTAIDIAHESVRHPEGQTGRKRTNDGSAAWMNARGHVRTATVVKSNVAGVSSMNYEVTVTGLCEIE